MKYRTRPDITIEALQFTGSNGAEVKNWVNSVRTFESDEPYAQHWFITKGMTASTGNQSWNYVKEGQKWSDKVRAAVYDHLQDAWIPVNDGDFIICGTKNEFYPCESGVFEAKYEEIK